ncbi:MAG: hypothetical protein QXF95_01165 [Candidatus Caldarchaeum sp.]
MLVGLQPYPPLFFLLSVSVKPWFTCSCNRPNRPNLCENVEEAGFAVDLLLVELELGYNADVDYTAKVRNLPFYNLLLY